MTSPTADRPGDFGDDIRPLDPVYADASREQVTSLEGVTPDGSEYEDDEDLDDLRLLAGLRAMLGHRTTRAIIRQPGYVLAGARLAIVRAWEATTTTRHERMMRAAEAVGDHETAQEWAKLAQAARDGRVKRIKEIALAPVHIATGLMTAAVIAFVLLLVVGVADVYSTHRIINLTRPFFAAIHMVQLATSVLAAVTSWTVLLGPWAVLLGLWHLGRSRASMPTWLAPEEDLDVDIEIDESTVARALQAMRIPQITEHFKAGLPLQFLTLPRQDGRGTYMQLRLPTGVTAEKIARRRADFATGLHRAAKETWPSTGSEAGIVELWVADKGALAEGAGPYPLLTEGVVDVFNGLPFGKTLRGDPITAPAMGRNTITGGMPEQGKSTSARTLMAGAALDPTVELRIWVPDANFDFEDFQPRCSSYIMGAERERIREIRDQLLRLKEELQVRGRLLIRYKEPEVTRKLANGGIGLHPIFVLLEEAHVAIQDREYGKEISQLLIDNVKLCRKRAVHIIVSTQAPTKDSMPRDVTRNCSNGIAFAVGDHVANDALLGQGAYAGGHRATELIPGVDRGTALVKGMTGERSEVLQVYYLDIHRGRNQAIPLIKRSLAEIAKRGTPVPGTGPAVVQVEAVRIDPLADIAEALNGEKRMTTTEVLRRLANKDEYYSGWNYTTLTRTLTEFDAAPSKYVGVMSVYLDRVQRALADRDVTEPSDDEHTES